MTDMISQAVHDIEVRAADVAAGKWLLSCSCGHSETISVDLHADLIQQLSTATEEHFADSGVCTCGPRGCVCQPCKGECGCLHCHDVWNDVLSMPEPSE